MAQQILTHTVQESDTGDRLDRRLASAFTELSRTRLKALIESGAVRTGDRTITDPSYRVKPGEVLQTRVPDAVAAELGTGLPDVCLWVTAAPASLAPAVGSRSGAI